jgi:hypothetical protein
MDVTRFVPILDVDIQITFKPVSIISRMAICEAFVLPCLGHAGGRHSLHGPTLKK